MLDDSQARIKIAMGNINTFRYADDTILMAENKEELKNLLMRVKEETEKAGLKLNIQETKIIASGPIQFSSVAQSCLTLCDPTNPITSWQIDGGKVEAVIDFIFLGSKITGDDDCGHEIK